MLIKLTAVVSPDLDPALPRSIYVDPRAVIVIELGSQQHAKEGSAEAWRQAMNGLNEEIQRVQAELSNPPSMAIGSEEDDRAARDWMRYRDAVASLNAAHSLLSRSSVPAYHPKQPCTIVSLSCGTALEHGVMLAKVYVAETPEKVAKVIEDKFRENETAGTLYFHPPHR